MVVRDKGVIPEEDVNVDVEESGGIGNGSPPPRFSKLIFNGIVLLLFGMVLLLLLFIDAAAVLILEAAMR